MRMGGNVSWMDRGRDMFGSDKHDIGGIFSLCEVWEKEERGELRRELRREGYGDGKRMNDG